MSAPSIKRKKRKLAPAAQKLASEKIPVLRREGKKPAQAVAEALSMARAGRLRPGGIYVPKGKS